MDNKKYERSSTDETVVFEGKVYCVKRPWVAAENGRAFETVAVEEGVLAEEDGLFPAVELEAVKNEDGIWCVNEVSGPEQYDEDGGVYGILLWSGYRGIMVNFFDHITYE